jgi:hypothetical protein
MIHNCVKSILLIGGTCRKSVPEKYLIDPACDDWVKPAKKLTPGVTLAGNALANERYVVGFSSIHHGVFIGRF